MAHQKRGGTPTVSCIVTNSEINIGTLTLVRAAYNIDRKLLVRIGDQRSRELFGNYVPVRNTVSLSKHRQIFSTLVFSYYTIQTLQITKYKLMFFDSITLDLKGSLDIGCR